MRGADRVRTLAAVAAIRQVQRRAAESELAQAAATAAKALQTRQAQGQALHAAEQGWLQSLTSQGMGPEMPRAWSGEVLAREQDLNAGLAALDQAKAQQDAANSALRARVADEHAAERMHKAAKRDVARRTEEALVAEAADRSARSARQ